MMLSYRSLGRLAQSLGGVSSVPRGSTALSYRPALRAVSSSLTSLRQVSPFSVSTIHAKPAVAEGVQAVVHGAESLSVMAANNGAVTTWLFGVGAMTFSMIVVGGITRLTKSGLSMTDWRIQGTLPPMNEEEWNKEFDRYKAFPEFTKNNNGNMSLNEFKGIFFWEYAHRMLGRSIGFVVGLPMVYFIAGNRVPSALRNRLLFLFALGGSQGLVGWWMVKSGLDADAEHMQKNFNTNDAARVSPYRLATHLTFAFIIYATTMWTAFSQYQNVVREKTAAIVRARKLVHPVAALIAITAVSGAFVAGNDAGRVYNTFPKMDGRWIPEHYWVEELGYRNFFENLATVQLNHRALAVTTLTAITTVYGALLPYRAMLPRSTNIALAAMLGVGWMQVGLGISTLVRAVPVELGSAHQAGALTLFTVILYVMHTLKYKRVPNPAMARAVANQLKN